MDAPRTILHVDMDAFFASIEQRDNPDLRGKPVLVGGSGPRGVVAAASYEARAFGCHSAQPMAIARRLCPHAVIVRHSGPAYREASQQVFAILESFTPLVQPVSVDEAYLDVTGSLRLFGSGERIAEDIRAKIREAVRVTASVGVAPNKFLAKLASEVNKPDGLAIIRPDAVLSFLRDLPVGKLHGVGPAAERRLHERNLRTVGDIARISREELDRWFGSHGEWLFNISRGRDPRPVVRDRDAKSVSHEHTFGRDVTDREHLRAIMLAQTEDVARRLRRHEFRAKGITLKIRYGDFETITRSRALESPTDRTDELWTAAREVFEAWVKKEGFKPIRLIGIGATVHDGVEQLDLFVDARSEKGSAVDRTADAIIAKFGKGAIKRGGSLESR